MPTLAAKISVSAPEMPKSIAALLPKVRRKPLHLARNGKTAAVLLSAREYQKLTALAAEAAEAEEDRYWVEIADEAMKEKPIGVAKSQKLLNRIANLK